MICTTFNNLKSLSLLQKSSNMYVTWLLFQLTPSSWTRQSTTISSVKMFAAQKQTKQSPLGQSWPGQPGSSFALWVDCTLLTISLTCHLGSHTPQAAFTDIVTKQRKWCFVDFVDVQWKWKDENWNRHTSAVQGAALRTGCHDPLWQSIFWTLLNSSPCSQKRLIFCVKNVFFYWVHWKKWNPKQNEHQMSFNERKKGNQKEVSSQVTPKRALNSCWSWHKSSITRCTCNHLGS